MDWGQPLEITGNYIFKVKIKQIYCFRRVFILKSWMPFNNQFLSTLRYTFTNQEASKIKKLVEIQKRKHDLYIECIRLLEII